MADILDRVRLAFRLEETRRAARRLFGDRYDEKIEPWREFVRKCCRAWDCRPLQVVPRLERDGTLPDQPLALIAASVDVSEEVSS